jgi:hypothetical protein
MNDEISQEGLAALAHARHRRAQERLRRDGAESRPAMQRRIQALAAERSIPPADYAKLMHKRGGTAALIAFCDKYGVSTDWLLMGDLKGLQRMTKWPKAKAEPRFRVGMTPDEFKEAFSRRSPELQQIISATLRRLVGGKPDEDRGAA